MNMNQKGFANVIIVLVGVIILAGIVGFFIINKQTPSLEPISKIIFKDGGKDSRFAPETYDWNVEFILCKECSPYKSDVFTEQELLLFKEELLAQFPDREASFEKLRSSIDGFFINMTDSAYKKLSAGNINLSGAKISTLYFKPFLGQQKTPLNENEIYTCSEDRECISVKYGQCGCSAGGSATAINRQYSDYWEGKNSEQGVMCSAVMSNDPSCSMESKCVQNKCRLQN